MHTLERGKRYESLDASIARIAYAYGFTAPPVQISRRALVQSDDHHTAAAASLLTTIKSAVLQPTQIWGSVRGSKGTTTVSFGILASRHAVTHALIIETGRAVAELLGLTNLSVLVSSAGDQESKRRFSRELGNFFKKQHEELSEEVRDAAARDPLAAYHTLVKKNDPLLERMPNAIDSLSENSRKIMLDTLSLFESVDIPYSIAPHLPVDLGYQTELLFAIEGTDRKGNRIRIATGGRFDEYAKRSGVGDSAVSLSVALPKSVELSFVEEAPACFVVHVGDAAKLKTFLVLKALARGELLVTQTVMAGTLRDQMDKARGANARFVAIIGQREALDGTVIVRNLGTQLQSVIPLDKLVPYLERRS